MRNRIFSTIIAAAFFVCAIAPALHAQTTTPATCTATLSWTPPTQYTNGDTIQSGDLTGFGIYVDGAKTDTAAGDATMYVVSGLAADGKTHSYSVTAIAKNGQESAMSNAATKACGDARVPKPPSLLGVVVAWLRHVWHQMFA